MPESPLVSIVTPSLNQKVFLPQAIESVLRQDYPKLEYIVVDGGSTDGTLEVLRAYQGRLKWFSEPDTGQSNAINKGFRMASGEIVAWINADDVLLAGAVGKAVAALCAEPDVAMVYGEGYVLDREGAIKGRFPYTEPFDLWRLVHVGDVILQQTVFMRKAALEQVGYLDESLHWGMDWDLFIRLGKRFRVQYIPGYLGCIREHPATKTFRGGRRRFRELGSIIRRHGGRRFLPSYFGYGLDTYYSMFAPLCGPAARRVLDKLHDLAGKHIWTYMAESQGWYPDGWAAPAAHFWFPNLRSEVQIEIQGSLPQLAAELPQQALKVVVNATPLCQMDLPVGPFRFVETIPRCCDEVEVLKIDLLATRSIAFRAYANRRWPRKVSYLLERIQMVPANCRIKIPCADSARESSRSAEW